MSTEHTARAFSKWRLVIAVAACLAVLAVPTGSQWVRYERSHIAPRLRSLVGKQVTLPQKTIQVNGKVMQFGPHTGTLVYVGYRFNDRWGWIDLEVHLRNGGESRRGLSPEEAAAVTEAR